MFYAEIYSHTKSDGLLKYNTPVDCRNRCSTMPSFWPFCVGVILGSIKMSYHIIKSDVKMPYVSSQYCGQMDIIPVVILQLDTLGLPYARSALSIIEFPQQPVT